MKRWTAVVFSLLCAGALAFAQEVKYEFDPTADFSKYHTYQWVSLPTAHPDQIVDNQIRRDIEGQLIAKGFMPAAPDTTPDIQVGYQISVNHEQQWNTWNSGPFWGGFGTITGSTITIGTLGIDFFDPSTKQLVWRGIGTKTIDPSGNPEKNMERLDKAVAKILKHFPPEKKK